MGSLALISLTNSLKLSKTGSRWALETKTKKQDHRLVSEVFWFCSARNKQKTKKRNVLQIQRKVVVWLFLVVSCHKTKKIRFCWFETKKKHSSFLQ